MSVALSAVSDAGSLPEYPIPKGERLESHYYIEFHYHRWMTSDTRLLADLDVRSVYLDLVFISQNQSPVGTLPTDPRLLAKLIGVSQEVFDALCKREVSPLHKWTQCLCDGDVRLHHPVVTELAVKALSGKTKNAEKREAERLRKRLGQIKTTLNDAIRGGADIAKSQKRLEMISGWIEENYPGGSATRARIEEAINALTVMD